MKKPVRYYGITVFIVGGSLLLYNSEHRDFISSAWGWIILLIGMVAIMVSIPADRTAMKEPFMCSNSWGEIVDLASVISVSKNIQYKDHFLILTTKEEDGKYKNISVRYDKMNENLRDIDYRAIEERINNRKVVINTMYSPSTKLTRRIYSDGSEKIS